MHSIIDSCCYSKRKLRGNRIFICVKVDDIIHICTSFDLSDSFKSCFSSKFSIEYKNSMKCFLGVSVEQSPGKLLYSQKSQILNILCCFGMFDCSPCGLPMTTNNRINKNSRPRFESFWKLNYLSVVSLPDLSFVVFSSSKVLKKRSHDYWL